jgi:acyl dehydratase
MTSELWLDDLHVGHRFRTDVYDLTADDIIEFATKWDPQPFHVSNETARETFFKGLAASGWHTAAITMRLLVTSGMPLANGIIGAGGEVAWPPRHGLATSSTWRARWSTCTPPSRMPSAGSSPSPSTP